MALLMGLMTGDDRVLDDPAPLVAVMELGDSAVIIKLRAWIRSGDYWATVWDLNKAIKNELQAAGYSIPFPQHDIHIVSGGDANP
jgi:small conductance mechanosensitive channel